MAGLFADAARHPLQVTLRLPTPLDVPLSLVELDENKAELRAGEHLIANAEPTEFDLEVPPVPSLAQAAAAAEASPSHQVHGGCFGCGNRPEGEGMRVFVGPMEFEGHQIVAGTWKPVSWMGRADGTIDPQYVLAALDCPGAFSFISADIRASLLGRIQFKQLEDLALDDEYVIIGWQIGTEGRKMFAGTAVADQSGHVKAVAKATWFPAPSKA
ncbi:MAG: hypothetical protein WC184_04780 [Acidimicrobiia bacterium]